MRSLEFDTAAFEDLAWWIEQDRNKALRIINLIKDIQRDPFRGIGKPEPLKQELKGCWRQAVIGDQQVRVMLNAVTFIDGAGRKLLADMHRQGVALVAEGFMMKAIIEEIIRAEDL